MRPQDSFGPAGGCYFQQSNMRCCPADKARPPVKPWQTEAATIYCGGAGIPARTRRLGAGSCACEWAGGRQARLHPHVGDAGGPLEPARLAAGLIENSPSNATASKRCDVMSWPCNFHREKQTLGTRLERLVGRCIIINGRPCGISPVLGWSTGRMWA